jgi:uncharacterized protein YkwD
MCAISAAMCLAASNSLGDAVAVANAVRSRGCGQRPGTAQALHVESKLDATAERVANGEGFEAALSASGYRAKTATILHFDVATGIGAVEQFLEGKFCKTITDPVFEAVGTAYRSHELWMVLAAPLEFPDTVDVAAVRAQVLDLTNKARTRAQRCGGQKFSPTGTLTASDKLDQAAQLHAEDMAARDVLTHAGRNGSRVRDRVTRAGYAWRAVAENIAEGQPTSFLVVRDWLESPEHCANLMNPTYTQMGVAFAVSERGPGRIYWVQVFAAPSE